MPVSIPELKRALRKEMMAKRQALSSIYRKQAGEKIAKRGIPVAVAPGSIVSGWCAMGAELDPLPLMTVLHKAGAKLALPAIVQGKLIFRAWTPGEALVSAGFGTSEPGKTSPEVDPDIVLTPMLAFDPHGFRLGYGKGHYDGGLARLRAVKKITAVGLAFDEQCADKVPAEPHDQRLDYVITENGVRFAGTS
jgi:5-formyltetrahydrofolate cyclo-ligase